MEQMTVENAWEVITVMPNAETLCVFFPDQFAAADYAHKIGRYYFTNVYQPGYNQEAVITVKP